MHQEIQTIPSVKGKRPKCQQYYCVFIDPLTRKQQSSQQNVERIQHHVTNEIFQQHNEDEQLCVNTFGFRKDFATKTKLESKQEEEQQGSSRIDTVILQTFQKYLIRLGRSSNSCKLIWLVDYQPKLPNWYQALCGLIFSNLCVIKSLEVLYSTETDIPLLRQIVSLLKKEMTHIHVQTRSIDWKSATSFETLKSNQPPLWKGKLSFVDVQLEGLFIANEQSPNSTPAVPITERPQGNLKVVRVVPNTQLIDWENLFYPQIYTLLCEDPVLYSLSNTVLREWQSSEDSNMNSHQVILAQDEYARQTLIFKMKGRLCLRIGKSKHEVCRLRERIYATFVSSEDPKEAGEYLGFKGDLFQFPKFQSTEQLVQFQRQIERTLTNRVMGRKEVTHHELVEAKDTAIATCNYLPLHQFQLSPSTDQNQVMLQKKLSTMITNEIQSISSLFEPTNASPIAEGRDVKLSKKAKYSRHLFSESKRPRNRGERMVAMTSTQKKARHKAPTIPGLLELCKEEDFEPAGGWDNPENSVVLGKKLSREITGSGKSSWRDLCAMNEQTPYERYRSNRGIVFGVDYSDSRGIAFDAAFTQKMEGHKNNSKLSKLKQHGTLFMDMPPTPLFAPEMIEAFKSGKTNSRAPIMASSSAKLLSRSKRKLSADAVSGRESSHSSETVASLQSQNMKLLGDLVDQSLGELIGDRTQDKEVAEIKSFAMTILEGCYKDVVDKKLLEEVAVKEKVSTTCTFAVSMKGT